MIGTEELKPSKPHYQDTDNLESVELSARAKNALRYGGYTTVGEVRRAKDTNLLRTPNFGSAALNEVRKKLANGHCAISEESLMIGSPHGTYRPSKDIDHLEKITQTSMLMSKLKRVLGHVRDAESRYLKSLDIVSLTVTTKSGATRDLLAGDDMELFEELMYVIHEKLLKDIAKAKHDLWETIKVAKEEEGLSE